MHFPDATIKWAVTWWQRQVRTEFNGGSACPHGGRIILLSFYDGVWQHGKPTMLELCFKMNLGWLIPRLLQSKSYLYVWSFGWHVQQLSPTRCSHMKRAMMSQCCRLFQFIFYFSLTTRWHSMSAIAENVAFSQSCSSKQTHATNWSQNLLVCAAIKLNQVVSSW